ncbi:MAG TPA: hypothetical protein VM581_05335 [Magnetospirillaceae bacterium]|nr:hypothetical protein [Magnetospirillaceae bacterium]
MGNKISQKWDNFTTSFAIFWEDVAPGLAWVFVLFIFFGVVGVGGAVALNMESSHSGRPPSADYPVTTTATALSHDYTAVTTALQSNGYVAGPTDTYTGNGRYKGTLWRPQTAAGPNMIRYAEGSQKDLIAQVRAADGSFWCGVPPQYQDKPSSAVAFFNEMVTRFKHFFAIGETLRLDIKVEQTSVKVVCSRVLQ